MIALFSLTLTLAQIKYCYADLHSIRTVEKERRIRQGEAIFNQWCISCHGAGPGHPGTEALEQIYHGEIPAALSLRTDAKLTGESIKYLIRNGRSIMPFFRKTEISDHDINLLVDYLTRNVKL